MILRVLVLTVILASSFAVVWASARWKGRARVGLEPGVVLVTAPGCSLCGPAERALSTAGVPYRTVDAASVPDLAVRSVPTLFMVDGSGEVVARRTGRAAVLSPAELARWS